MLELARSTAAAILEADPTLEAPQNAMLAAGLKKLRIETKDFSNIS